MNPDSVLDELARRSFDPGLTPATYENIIKAGFRRRSLPLAFVIASLIVDQHPLTRRAVLYRTVSAGWLPSTDKEHELRMGRILKTLRRAGIVPYSWVVDHTRSTMKPSSWSGLSDFADTAAASYRLDFWERLPDYVHVIVEKDAIAGVLQPMTREYDVALSPIRGYVSDSFAWEIAETWNQIQKPVFVFYMGDFDASGFDLERDLRKKLHEHCKRPFQWERLAVNEPDFEDFDLLPLEPKKKDRRYKRFIAEHGTRWPN